MTKRLALITSSVGYFLTAASAFAQQQIQINPPTQGGKLLGYTNIGSFISNVLTVIFIIAIIAVLFFIVWGAFDWITSGGDKEAVGKARNKIINALIGMAVLAVAYALASVAAQFLGFPSIKDFTIPGPV